MMAVKEEIRSLFVEKLGCETIEKIETVTRNALSDCFVFTTDQGKFFVKTHEKQQSGMYEAEAKGLRLLDTTATTRVPKPYYYGVVGESAVLVLEYIELTPHTSESMRELGKQLAKLHLTRWENPFGFDGNNYLGTTPQVNTWTRDWVSFFSQHRLIYQLRLLEKQYGYDEIIKRGEEIVENLVHWFADISVRPSLIHGDLWFGNTSSTSTGEPVFYDPACYYGHHEAELGLTSLFGGFLPEFYEAYHALIPKEKGFEERQKLYQLYHLLNHYHLFGESYREPLMEILKDLE